MSDELRAASAAVDLAATVVDTAVRRLAQASSENGKLSVAALDRHQAIAYDLAHAAAAVEGSRGMCRYGEHGEVESMLARAYVADPGHHGATPAPGRSQPSSADPPATARRLPFGPPPP